MADSTSEGGALCDGRVGLVGDLVGEAGAFTPAATAGIAMIGIGAEVLTGCAQALPPAAAALQLPAYGAVTISSLLSSRSTLPKVSSGWSF